MSLLYQDINGWSALRTGLSWMFMNVPFLLMAQLTGRLDRRHPPSRVVAAGCIVAAIGIFALSRATPTAPFVLTAVGYLLSGAGFGVLVPGVTHVAMRDVPSGASGAASGVVNASRQVGTSVGLAVLGSLGVTAATSYWNTTIRGLPSPIRSVAARQAQNVGGARIGTVISVLGPSYRHAAAQAFVHGYQIAVGVGAGCLLAAAVVALLGFRQAPGAVPPPEARRRRATTTSQNPSLPAHAGRS